MQLAQPAVAGSFEVRRAHGGASLDEAAEKLEDDDLLQETSEYLQSRQSLVAKDKFVKDLDHVLETFLK